MGRTYLYGIMEGTTEAVVGISGVDGVSPVHVVGERGLGCIVSDYDGEDFETMSREELVRRLFTHQQVIERVMQHRTMLPVKFGTLFGNAGEILDLLSQGRSDFVNAIASLRDRIEVEVAATWDTGRILVDIGKEEEIVRAREAIALEGQLTVEGQIHLGQLVKECMDRRRNSYRERMTGFLRPFSVGVVANGLVSDQLVMNVAFLVDRVRQDEFDDRVHRLDELFRDEITFKVIGPLPPYSFSTVEVARLTPERVEKARQALLLGADIVESEVRKAYRRLAADEQRNLRLSDEPSNGRFSELRQASQLLLSYCRAQKRSQGDGYQERDRQGPSDLFAIAIKGTRSNEVELAHFSGTIKV